jgi:hypothetical protein
MEGFEKKLVADKPGASPRPSDHERKFRIEFSRPRDGAHLDPQDFPRRQRRSIA